MCGEAASAAVPSTPSILLDGCWCLDTEPDLSLQRSRRIDCDIPPGRGPMPVPLNWTSAPYGLLPIRFR